MGVLEAAARIIELGGGEHRAVAAELRGAFEARTGTFSADDPWFEERSRAFWCDAVTRGRFGRMVEAELSPEDRRWLGPLERAHRGLFRRVVQGTGRTETSSEELLVDLWSGAEIVVSTFDDATRAELGAAAGQLLDARVVGDGADGGEEPSGARPLVALLPGAVFHPRSATIAIEAIVETAHARGMTTHDTLDALLRMERALRALSRVKAAYAYRTEALSTQPSPAAHLPVRRAGKGPT
jgi:hypothetical protein